VLNQVLRPAGQLLLALRELLRLNPRALLLRDQLRVEGLAPTGHVLLRVGWGDVGGVVGLRRVCAP